MENEFNLINENKYGQRHLESGNNGFSDPSSLLYFKLKLASQGEASLLDNFIFICKDYFNYTKGRLVHFFRSPLRYWESTKYHQNKILCDLFLQAEASAKIRNIRQKLFFLGLWDSSLSIPAPSPLDIKKTSLHQSTNSTSKSFSMLSGYSNLKTELEVSGPEQLWIADITLASTRDGKKYFHIITDAYSKQVVGYNITDTLNASSTIDALKMALSGRKYCKELIHHSQRGIHYCIHEYKKILLENKIKMSASLV